MTEKDTLVEENKILKNQLEDATKKINWLTEQINDLCEKINNMFVPKFKLGQTVKTILNALVIVCEISKIKIIISKNINENNVLYMAKDKFGKTYLLNENDIFID